MYCCTMNKKYLEICINKSYVYIHFRYSIHPVNHTNIFLIVRLLQFEMFQYLKRTFYI